MWDQVGPQTDPSGNVWTLNNGVWVNGGPSPVKTTPSPTGGGNTGGPNSPAFQWPTFTPPAFTPAAPFQAPAPYTPPVSYVPTQFNYGDFQAPTLADAQNQPGYQFGLQQGQDALQNSAAARGLLRGGGTLKDLFNYTNSAAEQNYGNVFNQDLTTYGTNRSNAYGNWAQNEQNRAAAYGVNANLGADAYKINYGSAKDVYDTGTAANQSNYNNNFQNASAAFNPQFQGAQLSFADLYNRWKTQVDSLTQLSKPV